MITKILTWLKANGATLFGMVQAIIKVLKEILTGVVNLLSIIMPASSAQKLVLALRDLINKLDDWIEQMKSKYIPTV